MASGGENEFWDWLAADAHHAETVPVDGPLVIALGEAYKRIDVLLDEAEQLQGVGDSLESAKRRASAARQGCSALTRVTEDPEWPELLDNAQSLLSKHGRTADRVVRSTPAWWVFARAEQRLLRAAEVSDERAARLLSDARGEYLQRLARNEQPLSAATIHEYLRGVRETTCHLAETLEQSYKRLASKRARVRFIRNAVGGALLVAADAAPGVATAGALAAIGAATSIAVGGALFEAAGK